MKTKYSVYRLYSYRKARVKGFKYDATYGLEYACESSILIYSTKISGFKSIPIGVTFQHKETPLTTVLKRECLPIDEKVAIQNPSFTIEFKVSE